MAAKPKNKAPKALLAGALLSPRERLWNTMRVLRSFTVEELQDKCMPLVPFTAAKKYVQCLVRGGVLKVAAGKRQRQPDGHYLPATYELLKDQLEAPRFRDSGKACTEGVIQLAMWRAMQTLRTFETAELHRAVNLPAAEGRPAFEVSMRSVQAYKAALLRAGYLFEQRGKVDSSGGRAPSIYRLIRNTGALAPMVTRQQVVIDRNQGSTATVETAQEVVDANA